MSQLMCEHSQISLASVGQKHMIAKSNGPIVAGSEHQPPKLSSNTSTSTTVQPYAGPISRERYGIADGSLGL